MARYTYSVRLVLQRRLHMPHLLYTSFISILLIVLLLQQQKQQQQQQQHQRTFLSIDAHSACWDSANNIVIPFWNIAARHHHQQQRQRQRQQQQQNLLQRLQPAAAAAALKNDTDNEATIDFCVVTSLSKGPELLPPPPPPPRRRRRRTLSNVVPASNYRGGAAATTTTTTTTTSSTFTSSDAVTNTTTRVDEGYKPLIFDKKYPYQFSFFQSGDGSDDDADGIPTRFLVMQNQDRALARTAAQSTLAWRKQHDIDKILQRPQIYFDIAKQVFPHYFVDVRDTTNHIIFVQRPALLNLHLANHNHLTPTKLLEHYIYVNEYLWQILEGKNALATMTSIIDMQGMNLKYLRQGDIVNFMKEFVKTMDNHYPQRAHKTLIINAPKWFNILYKIVSPLLRESTKAKIEIYNRGKRQDKVLKALLGNSDKAEKLLPASFFMKKKDHKPKKDDRKQMMKNNRRGMHKEIEEETTEGHDDPVTATTADGEETHKDNEDDEDIVEEGALILPSKFETELREFTLARIKEAGVKMLEVVPLTK